jgi:hypothetical protein
MRKLPRRQLWQHDPCRPPVPRSNQRFPCISFEKYQIEYGPCDRFKGCVRDTRAETFKPGSAHEFIALELYVASRGNGLVRRRPIGS